jgi:hypothetical protein
MGHPGFVSVRRSLPNDPRRDIRYAPQATPFDPRFAEMLNVVVEIADEQPDLPDRWSELDEV